MIRAIVLHIWHVFVSTRADFGHAAAVAITRIDRWSLLIAATVSVIALALATSLAEKEGLPTVFFKEHIDLFQLSDNQLRRNFYNLVAGIGFFAFLALGFLVISKQ